MAIESWFLYDWTSCNELIFDKFRRLALGLGFDAAVLSPYPFFMIFILSLPNDVEVPGIIVINMTWCCIDNHEVTSKQFRCVIMGLMSELDQVSSISSAEAFSPMGLLYC